MYFFYLTSDLEDPVTLIMQKDADVGDSILMTCYWSRITDDKTVLYKRTINNIEETFFTLDISSSNVSEIAHDLRIVSEVPEPAGHTLRLLNFTEMDAGSYRCEVLTASQSNQSKDTSLEVKGMTMSR